MSICGLCRTGKHPGNPHWMNNQLCWCESCNPARTIVEKEKTERELVKPAYFGCEDSSDRTGIDITFNRAQQTVTVGGWYDTMCGIGGETVPLKEFLQRIGITPKDVMKLLEDERKLER